MRDSPQTSSSKSASLAVASTTTIAGLAALALKPPLLILVCSILFTALLCLQLRTFKAALSFLKWAAPLIVPAMLLHGLLNPSYSSTPIGLGIHWRPDGIAYATTLAVNFALLSAVAIHWLYVPQSALVDALIRSKMPVWTILLTTQSVAVASSLRRQISNVYLAQQARGIQVGPRLWHRLRALPSVLVPSVISTLVDAEGRVTALASRGFGAAAPARPPRSKLSNADLLFAAAPLLIVIAALTASFV